MSAAAAVAFTDPDAIKAVFVVNENLVAGYQTYGVRLYDATGQARWVTVNNHLAVEDEAATAPLYSKLASVIAPQDTKLWLPLLEKAYAQMNEQGFLSRDPGSSGKNAMWAIEGKKTMGLELAARAGYLPDASVSLWQKMGKASGSQQAGLAFLSTHPSGPDRIRELQQNVPKVQGLYQAARKAG